MGGLKTLRSERFGARLKQFYVAILLTPGQFPGEFPRMLSIS
jgi:hypothetical protein